MSTIAFLRILGVLIYPALFMLLMYLWDKEAFMRRWNRFRGKDK